MASEGTAGLEDLETPEKWGGPSYAPVPTAGVSFPFSGPSSAAVEMHVAAMCAVLHVWQGLLTSWAIQREVGTWHCLCSCCLFGACVSLHLL